MKNDQLFSFQLNCRFNELDPVEQLEMIKVINAIASNRDGRATGTSKARRRLARMRAINRLLKDTI
jgi:hypothetical protein